MTDTGRIRYFQAETERIKYCLEIVKTYDLCEKSDRESVRDILREIYARLDMWDALQNGDYECHCSQDEKDILIYG